MAEKKPTQRQELNEVLLKHGYKSEDLVHMRLSTLKKLRAKL
jgi:hypothetical protein